MSEVSDALRHYIGGARWFGGKGRTFSVAGVHRLGTLPGPDPEGEGPVVAVDLVTLEYDEPGAPTETYQVPLALYRAPQERLEHALVGTWRDEELGEVVAYDALHDRQATVLWLRAFAGEHEDQHLEFHRVPGHDLDLESIPVLFSGEQSNSSVAFGEDSLMKVFRKVTPGHNPDIEIEKALTEAESENVPALYGWLEAPASEATGGEPLHLAMLQQFLRTASDGWDLALASVRDLYAEADLHADEVGGDFAGESHRLGVATAHVHRLLAEAFPTETWGREELAAHADAMRRRLDEALAVVPALEEHADALRRVFAGLERVQPPVVVQRVHGDFHLGQTMRTVRGWKIVDFEGEPAKPLAERIRPDSPWRDVAGMLRSFDYAAHAVEADVEADADEHEQLSYRATEWATRNQQAFLAGYAAAEGDRGDEAAAEPALSDDQWALLRAYEADKAVYETVYETRNRPDWVGIPLGALHRLTTEETSDR
ncbi:MAG: maltokinase N-terminal cap-like domain-containing protein [Nocardioidaceae bacterium]